MAETSQKRKLALEADRHQGASSNSSALNPEAMTKSLRQLSQDFGL
jgi:hypothetical protein